MTRTIMQLDNYTDTITDSLTMSMEGKLFLTELSLHITKGTLLLSEDYELFRSKMSPDVSITLVSK